MQEPSTRDLRDASILIAKHGFTCVLGVTHTFEIRSSERGYSGHVWCMVIPGRLANLHICVYDVMKRVSKFVCRKTCMPSRRSGTVIARVWYCVDEAPLIQ